MANIGSARPTLNHWAERKIKEELAEDYLKSIDKKLTLRKKPIREVEAPIHKSFWILLTGGLDAE